MASGGSEDYDIGCMEDNLRIFDRVVDDLTTAARLLDEKRDRARYIKYTAGATVGVSAVLGAAGFLLTGGLSSVAMAGAAASVAVGVLVLLAQIVDDILKRSEFDDIERRWDELKKDVARRKNIPRQNKDRIADWARHELDPSSARAVIAAVEKSSSGSQTTDRMKALSSADVNELLESLLCIVAADFTIFETLVGALKERDEPGDAIRNITAQVQKNKAQLRRELETARREERERREREERERREREERERREREEQERREREEQERREREEQERREREERERREREECAMFVMELHLPPPGVAGASSQSARLDNPQDPRHLETSRSTEPLLPDFQKVSVTSELNLLTSYSAERGVQTTDPVVHAGFPPVFCSQWDLIAPFDRAGGTLRKAKSDVILEVPRDAIPRDSLNVDVHMSVCVDIDRIQKSLNLPKSHFVASPLVEFWAGEGFRFLRPVQITLPYCPHPGVDSDKVVVYRATKYINGETILNKLKPQAAEPGNLDFSQWSLEDTVRKESEAAYYVSGDGKLFITTDCFSGFVVCAYCGGKNISLPMLTMFGSGTNKFQEDNFQMASVHLHIWDTRLSIRDFSEGVQSTEEPNVVTDKKQLALSKAHQKRYQTLLVRFYMMGRNMNLWNHCQTTDGMPAFPEERRVDLTTLLGCDKETCMANKVLPQTIDWMLETVNPSAAGVSLRCFVEVTHVPGEVSTRLPVELERPLNTSELMALDLEELKRLAEQYGVSSNTLSSIFRCSSEEEIVKSALLNRLINKHGRDRELEFPECGRPSRAPVRSLSSQLGVANYSSISSSESDITGDGDSVL